MLVAPMLLFVLTLGACGDKDGGGDAGTPDGGADSGMPGDGGDGGDTAPPPDDCDDHAGALVCVDGDAVTCDDAGDVLSIETCADDTVCQDGAGCISCAVQLDGGLGPDAEGPARVRLADPLLAWEERRFSMRPVTLSADPLLLDAVVLLDLAGGGDTGGGDTGVGDTGVGDTGGGGGSPVRVWSEDGAALSLPLSVDAADLPLTVLVEGLADGAQVQLQAAVDGACDAPAATLDLAVAPWLALAGRQLPASPWLERVDAFTFDQIPAVALEADRHGDLAGRDADLYLVAHRSLAEWVADPVLVDAGEGAQAVTITGDGAEVDRWALAAEPLPVTEGVIADAYDVVLDLDGDGMLSPGDLFEGPDQADPALVVLGDLTAAGPLDVTIGQHRPGVWLGQRVYYPTDVATVVAERGPRPLVIISHGNGHDYRWYDYLGEHLASWGYVVMAHENETGPGIETASSTTLNNTEWFLENVETIVDGELAGMVDGHRIAWIGHSRGGEGVTRAYDRLLEGDIPAAEPIDAYEPDDIVFISSIAPTVFLGVGDSNPHDRWYHLIAGSADGDVTGGPYSGVVQYQRLSEVATQDVAVTYVHGASHNDFNCCGSSDGTGPDLIGPDAAQALAKSTYLALLQWVVEDDPAPRELITRSFGEFRDAGLTGPLTVANQWRPGSDRGRLVLDNFQAGPAAAVSSAGTLVTSSVAELTEARMDDADSQFEWDGDDPMNGMTLAEDRDDPSRGAVFEWQEDSTWRVELPKGEGDLRDWTWLSLRACQGTRHPNTVKLGEGLTFSVALIDGAGVEQVLPLRDLGQIVTYPYQRGGYGRGLGWANEWNTLRVRVEDFALDDSALDLSDIVAVELRFGPSWGSPLGRLGLDDVMFVND